MYLNLEVLKLNSQSQAEQRFCNGMKNQMNIKKKNLLTFYILLKLILNIHLTFL